MSADLMSWGSNKPIRSNGAGKPVVALDIDGTLGDYHTNFLEFAWRYFDRGPKTWDPQAVNPGLPLWDHMGISLREYRDAKLAYRQGGWKRWMPVYREASAMTHFIRDKMGAEVWLCTTRPYLRLDNVDPDTREWLRRNNIAYDALLFDPAHEEDGSKYDELARQGGQRVASIVDDLPEMITAARNAFYSSVNSKWIAPILREQPYNRTFKYDRRATDLLQAWELVVADIEAWRLWND